MFVYCHPGAFQLSERREIDMVISGYIIKSTYNHHSGFPVFQNMLDKLGLFIKYLNIIWVHWITILAILAIFSCDYHKK